MSTPDHLRANDHPRELVLVGAGHAHVEVLRAFAAARPPAVRITVVVDAPISVYSGMIPGLVSGQYEPRELEIDARALAERAGAGLVHAAATGVDPGRRQVRVDGGPSVPYDLASFDIGSTVRGLELPGVAEHALSTRPIGRFAEAMSSVEPVSAGHHKPQRIAVVGGGAAGVELALALHARSGRVETGPVEVLLLHAGPRVLSGAHPRLVRRVERALGRRGIRTVAARVRAVGPDRLVLESGEELRADFTVWAAGAASHGVLAAQGLPTDAHGFVRTRETLQVDGFDDMFAVGDCAFVDGFPNTPKAGVHAVRQGPVLAHNLRAILAGEPLRSYRPQRDFLKLLNLGDGTAIGEKWGVVVEGRWVMVLKDRIDRRFVERYQFGQLQVGRPDRARTRGGPVR